MRCEQVRPLLPEMAEGVLREAGAAERHVASCLECAGELGQLRTVVLELAALRDEVVDPAPEFLERILARVPEDQRPRLLHRVASDERLHLAALSLGGAVVGATAIGLLWWRAARRAVGAAPAANGARLASSD